MLCRQQVAQLRPYMPAIADSGTGLVLIGNGTPAQLAGFRNFVPDGALVYTDPSLHSFAALGMRRGLLQWRTLRHGWQAWRQGFRQGTVQGDAWQLGGAALVLPDGTLPYVYRSREAGDHPRPEDLLTAMDAVAGLRGDG